MKALRFVGNELRVDEVNVPDAAGECLVRVVKSGICNTDLEIVRGYAGFEGTIGHEFVGVVEKADENPEIIGKRVVGEINAGCGQCEKCAAGDPRHCAWRTVLGIKERDGAHAEFLTLPARNLLEVPENVSDDAAVFTEPLAAAFGITEQIDVSEHTRIAIVGDGKLGILCALALALKSNNVTLVGKHGAKLDLARRSGMSEIETILLSGASKHNQTFDAVVEASGSETGFATALDLIRPRGKMILKSTFQGKANLEMWRVVVDEITIVGSRCGLFAPALEILAGNKIKVENFITDEFSLGDGVKALKRAAEKDVMKVVLKM